MQPVRPQPTDHPRTTRRARRLCVAALAGSLALLAACTDGTPDGSGRTDAATSSPSPTPTAATLQASPPPATVTDDDAAVAAVQTSAALFASAPVVVLADVADVPGQLTAATAAVAVGAPVLLTGAGADVAAEVERLEPRAALVVGAADPAVLPDDVDAVPLPAGADADALADVTGRPVGADTPVAAGGEAAAVRALAPGDVAVLRPQAADGAAADGAATSGTPADGGSGDTATPAPSGSATTSAPAGRDDADEDGPARLPATASPATGPVVLGLVAGPQPLAALATLRAAGAGVLDVPGADPRATAASVDQVAQVKPAAVVALGAAFGPADHLAQRVATAATGVQLPGGGQLVFPAAQGQPGKRYVALYGTPGSSALGVLGEQDVPATLARAEQHAAPYRALTTDTVVPMVEIIATIASAGAGDDGDYSAERPVEDLRPLVEAAGAAGTYVVLDLQPGRTDFVTQAQRYADLLAMPHVGLALDPEWRLAPDQVHLRQIGSVSADEVNATAAWLAQFTRDRDLPQKMFVLHQFQLRMIGDRERLDTSHDELATVIHVDGQGTQPAKAGTWATLRAGAPPVHWGWKNFYDEDQPMLDPVQTYQVQPVPDLVTYQ
ncbi:hypothetical protein GC089_06795 [Cellulomonas sp. JZ18]|uniref:hypothetical protein n=1 Tax=Cellulomonas sp. JZ18 TaxID=2654191 RepID=UPI0012D48E89|nr:hypothetical protein [Cellulomonas sp. JZ18]QGQ18994.1 hypothetical protein GC089_06795 [Cellulomonas sp. JZ18]